MGPSLYICEKPDQARIVSRALGDADRKDGYFSCAGDAQVTWCFGHLLETKMPEDYDPDLKEWSWETLPIIPPFGFKPGDGGAGKQLKIISKLLQKCGEVVVSTDADREGELIAYEILTYLKYNGPIRRLWINDLTIDAVRRALENLRPGEETRPLYHAALARTFADWIVGMNMTRATTLKLRERGKSKPLSIGRVQTPTLALLVRREREIKNFKPEDYFELEADVSTAAGETVRMRFSLPEEKRIKDRATIEKLRAQAEGAAGPIGVETTQKSTQPPELLNLGRLQQRCNTLFGWSADHTLSVAQSLYETHQALTYPRTDCPFLPEEHADRISTIIANLIELREFAHLKQDLNRPQVRKRHYNDTKITAHHAIVPTLQAPQLGRMSADERNMYILVSRFYLSAHLPNYDYLATKMSFDANGVPFTARGAVPLVMGWKDAFRGIPEDGLKDEGRKKADEEEEDSQGTLPDIKDGEKGKAQKVEAKTKTTTPPAHFTEASLLRAMERVAEFVDDEDAKKRLRQTSGIGTPATRANIIETLKQRDYIKIAKRKIIPTEVGTNLIGAMEMVTPVYADPATTAQWEDGLEEIANRKVNTKEFVKAIADRVKDDVQKMKDATDLPKIVVGSDDDWKDRKRKPNPEWEKKRKEALAKGIPLRVDFEDRNQVKALGAIWDGDNKRWVVPPDADIEEFRRRGFLPKA